LSTNVACVVLSKNEELRIEDCLRRLRPYVDFIILVDDSTDRTRELAKPYVDAILFRPGTLSGSFATERNHAEDYIPIGFEWILHVDVDERFSQEFLENLKSIISIADPLIDAYRFPRVNEPDRKDYPDYQVRLLRRGRTIWKKDIHEVPYHPEKDKPIDQVGTIITLDKYPIIHAARREDQKREWWEEK